MEIGGFSTIQHRYIRVLLSLLSLLASADSVKEAPLCPVELILNSVQSSFKC